MNKTEFKNLIEECIREVNEERDIVYLTDNEVAFILKESYVPLTKRDRLLQEGKKKMSLAEAEALLRREFEEQVDFVESYRLFKEAALRGPGGRFIKKTPSPEATSGSSAQTYTVNVDASAGGETPKGKGNRKRRRRRRPKTGDEQPSGRGGRGRPKPGDEQPKDDKKNSPARAATAKQVVNVGVKVTIKAAIQNNPEEMAKLLKKLEDLEARGIRMEEALKKLLDSPQVKKEKDEVIPDIANTPPAPVKPDAVPGTKPGGFFSRMVNFVKDNKTTILGTLGTIAAIGGAAALSSTGLGAMLAPVLSSKTVRNAVMGGASGLVGGTISAKMKGGSWKDSLKQGLKTGAKAAAGGALIGLGQDAFGGGGGGGVINRATSPDLGWSGDDTGGGDTGDEDLSHTRGELEPSNRDNLDTVSTGAANAGGVTLTPAGQAMAGDAPDAGEDDEFGEDDELASMQAASSPSGNPSDAEQFPDDTDSGMVAGGGEEPLSNEPDAGEDDELASLQASSRPPGGDTNDDDDVKFGDEPGDLGAGSPPDDYEERYNKSQETAREDEEGVDTTPAGGSTDAASAAGGNTGAASAAGNETPVATGEIGADSENYGKLTTPAEKLGFAEDAAEKARERGDAENERFWQSYAEEERANLTGGAGGAGGAAAASPAAAASAEPKMKENPDIYEDPRVDTKSNLRYADAEGNRYAEPGDGRTDTRKIRKEQYARLFVPDSTNPNVMKLKR